MQLTLPLPTNKRKYRPVLVDLNCAATTLEINPENILEMVECGELRWVWDLARAGAVRRELRFDLGELLRRQAKLPPGAETLDQVIARVIGRSEALTLHTPSVCDILQVRRQTVHEWLKAGELLGPPMAAHKQPIYRASLVQFLRQRIQSNP